MPTLSQFQLQLSGATWIDVNTNYTIDTLPDRLPDAQSVIYCSLFNLFNCPIGSRGPIFQPEYGTVFYHLLQEPVDDTTATKIRLGVIDAIRKWEPRIRLDDSQTSVTPVYDLPGYYVKIAFSMVLTKEPGVAAFNLTAG